MQGLYRLARGLRNAFRAPRPVRRRDRGVEMNVNEETKRTGRARIARLLAALAVLASAGAALGHGDVTPQAVDTHELKPLGEAWLAENPYRDDKVAIRIGTSAFNQNCARCHGLEAISGGIAPDLRKLDRDCVDLPQGPKLLACYKETDQYFLESIRRGKVRNGAVYMPPFEGILNQEAMWSIKAYLETRRTRE